jgi:hypothetical protein
MEEPALSQCSVRKRYRTRSPPELSFPTGNPLGAGCAVDCGLIQAQPLQARNLNLCPRCTALGTNPD